MTAGEVGGLLAQAMLVIVKLGAPPLGAALVVGVLIALVQAVTQINEATLAFVPKIVALGITMMFLGSFMFATLAAYTHLLFDRMVTVGGS